MKTPVRILSAALLVGALATGATAMVMQNDTPPASRPGDAMVGEWGTNASAVAIDPNYVLTTCHQGGGVGSVVALGGVAYQVTAVADNGADLRVARVARMDGTPAELAQVAALFTGADASLVGSQVVLGGFGQGRGSVLTTGGVASGYNWAGSGSMAERWGTNTIDRVASGFLIADFDAPGTGTANEAIIAAGDSGGGWFTLSGGRWTLVGLTSGGQRVGTAYFSPADLFWGGEVSANAAWIQSIVTAGNAAAGTERVSPIPEPGRMGLLAVGGAMWLASRRRRGARPLGGLVRRR